MNVIEVSQKKFLLLLILIFIIAEFIWSLIKKKKIYEPKDTLANIVLLTGFQTVKITFLSAQLELLAFISKFQILDIEKNILYFAITFLWVDFVYYWYHRLSHKVKFLWAFHVTHHSSQLMNLTTAYRLNWFSVILSPFVFGPLDHYRLPNRIRYSFFYPESLLSILFAYRSYRQIRIYRICS